MKIRTKVGSGKVVHAADYNPKNLEIQLYCDSLKYNIYFAEISDPTPPTSQNVTCKKCLKIINKGSGTK